MRTVYETSEKWTIAAGVAIDIMHDLKSENERLENELNEARKSIEDALADRDCIAEEWRDASDQCADLGAALEAAKKRIEKLTADLEKADADNAALVRRNVEKAQAAKQEAAS